MNFLSYQACVRTLLQKYRSCSLVNGEGALLYSKDGNSELLTTTRLVSFQIVKKYLNPKPLDLFLLNDPENGGYRFSKLIFISCLTPDLFLIWDEDYFQIQYKIPPTPLYDQGIKNEFVWQALTAAHYQPAELESFLEYQKYNVDRLLGARRLLSAVANPRHQQGWLKASQEAFGIQFNNKAQGSFDSHHRLSSGQSIKLKFSAEERQHIKLLTLDFTNTNLCSEIYTSSHVIESALVKKIMDYYQIGGFFSQAILDKIKVILPPKSIVSRPHPTGDCNFELQTICSQLCEYNMQQLNSHARKLQTGFSLHNFLHFEIYDDRLHSSNLLTGAAVQLCQFEDLLNHNRILLKTMRRHEGVSQVAFEVTGDAELKLKINNHYQPEKNSHALTVNGRLLGERGITVLRPQDNVELIWRQSV